MASLTEYLRKEAERLGFVKVGIAPAEPLTSEAGRLAEWLASGYQATMAWMERTREKRGDPRLVYPAARSIVVVAMNYYDPTPHPATADAAKISRYAWGEDYHRILTGRLEELLASIRTADAGADGLVYVDTGPIMEKAWAHRSGLGWQGKHTNIITQEYGSWLFLGVILLNRELAYDQPAADHCGSCTLCIDACPTAAIVAPHVLDSRRCISYLTIEHRGEIPDDLGARCESWAFGCDVCQDVCPWNERFAQASTVEGFHPRPELVAPLREDLRRLTEEEFRSLFRTSPVKRATHAGLVRNVSLATVQHSPKE